MLRHNTRHTSTRNDVSRLQSNVSNSLQTRPISRSRTTCMSIGTGNGRSPWPPPRVTTFSGLGTSANRFSSSVKLNTCPSPALNLHKRNRHVVARSGGSAILPLGFDLLTYLTSTVVMVPLFKRINVSPVLGFLLSGILLHQFGLIRDPKDMEALSELGVLFLLFEMGLELSLDRLKALAKYAFGLGTLQVLICTGIFTAFALPAGQGIGSKMLEYIAHASPSLVSIRSVDEAIVIGAALSLSSSAFVLQLLQERGEMPTKQGQATLGILLLQDIAVVPFLVLLPLVVSMQAAVNPSLLTDPSAAAAAADSTAAAVAAAAASNPASLVALLGPTALKTIAGLAALLFGGRVLLRRVFEVVAQSDNSETFVGLCLLTVAGAALLTKELGFSDTMGAFVAGVLLSESNYKTQVEADIRPFRGLLLGLFFVTTGGSIDMNVLVNNWQVIGWILLGLITTKTAVVAALGPQFGLSKSESIKTGFILSQGGEFAFVLLSLASSLHILPDNLNQVLIIVVVMSMALTPGLAEVGKTAGDWIDEWEAKNNNGKTGMSAKAMEEAMASMHSVGENPVVICGFGPHGQMLATLLDQPLASLPEASARAYIAFDLDPAKVQAGRAAGFNVVYGDGSRAAVLKAAGVTQPRAIAVCLTTNKTAMHRAVESLRASFPTVPLYALGADIRDAAELEHAGADRCIMGSTAMGIALGTEILTSLGASMSEATQVSKEVEAAMTLRARSLAERIARTGADSIDENEIILWTSHANLKEHTNMRSGLDMIADSEGGVVATQVVNTEKESNNTNAADSNGNSRNGAVLNGSSAAVNGASIGQAVTTGESSVNADSNNDPGVVVTVEKPGLAAVKTKKKKLVEEEKATQSYISNAASGVNNKDGALSGTPRQPNSPRAKITGTAVAKIDCGSDDDNTDEEVAGIVFVDATKQQLVTVKMAQQSEHKSATSSASSPSSESAAPSRNGSVDGGDGTVENGRKSGTGQATAAATTPIKNKDMANVSR